MNCAKRSYSMGSDVITLLYGPKYGARFVSQDEFSIVVVCRQLQGNMVVHTNRKSLYTGVVQGSAWRKIVPMQG